MKIEKPDNLDDFIQSAKADYDNVMTIPPNVKYQDRFLRAYRQARKERGDCGRKR